MKLIVGLGNPGKEYEETRHNSGFKVMDLLSRELNAPISKSDFKGLYTKINYQNESVILLKPQTFMNLSGESVRPIMDYFKISIDDLIVIVDDLDTEIGKIRLRKKGSDGGQNGIKNIILHLGSQEFKRIRVGIGKDDRINTVDYVLGKVRKEDKEDYDEALVDAKNAVLDAITDGFDHAMNKFNGVKQ